MSYEIFIAKRLLSGKEGRGRLTNPVIRIATAGIALGVAVMLVAVMIVTGFRNEISAKVMGFGAHIRIGNFDSNNSFEESPITPDTALIRMISDHPSVTHWQTYATKAGIIKTKDEISGVVLKGIGSDYQSGFFEANMISGTFIDPKEPNSVVISQKSANQLRLKTGDEMVVYFIEQPPRVRKLKISGIYNTGLDEFDNLYAFCNIKLIRKLNNWNENQSGGIEILINDLSKIESATDDIYHMAGYQYYTQNIREQYPQIFHWLDLQNINVIIIITLILLIAGVSMVSTLLILILENTTLIGIMKSMGATDISMRKIFMYIAVPVIGTGLLAGNILGIGLGFAQEYFGIISLPEESYYVSKVPVHISIKHILLLNAGTLIACFLMLLGPSMVISRILPTKVIRFD
jgi:lipoprotein-releasing system permease protein